MTNLRHQYFEVSVLSEKVVHVCRVLWVDIFLDDFGCQFLHRHLNGGDIRCRMADSGNCHLLIRSTPTPYSKDDPQEGNRCYNFYDTCYTHNIHRLFYLLRLRLCAAIALRRRFLFFLVCMLASCRCCRAAPARVLRSRASSLAFSSALASNASGEGSVSGVSFTGDVSVGVTSFSGKITSYSIV